MAGSGLVGADKANAARTDGAPAQVELAFDFKRIRETEIAMHTVDLADAEKQLPQLINEAAEGEDVIIRRPDGRTFRIVPTAERKPHPTFGSARGKIKIGDDFDAPLRDFEEYMP